VCVGRWSPSDAPVERYQFASVLVGRSWQGIAQHAQAAANRRPTAWRLASTAEPHPIKCSTARSRHLPAPATPASSNYRPPPSDSFLAPIQLARGIISTASFLSFLHSIALMFIGVAHRKRATTRSIRPGPTNTVERHGRCEHHRRDTAVALIASGCSVQRPRSAGSMA
jgi:hypothetical protein